MVQAWEEEPLKAPNPYAPSKSGKDSYILFSLGRTQSDIVVVLTAEMVRLSLAQEDKDDGEADSALHAEITASMFIQQGIDIEDARYNIPNYSYLISVLTPYVRRRNANDAKDLGLHATDIARSKVAEKANSIRRRYDAWIKVQNLYMPTVAARRERVDAERKSEDDERSVHDACLLLPSDLIGTATRFNRGLAASEFRFRVAQAYTTLDTLRGHILSRSHLWISKKRIASGTVQSTRSNNLITTLGTKIKRCAGKYRDIYRRLLKLREYAPAGHANEADPFQPLLDEHLSGLSFMEEGPEKDKRSSWIWNVKGFGENADDHGQAGTYIYVKESCHANLIVP